MLKYPALAPSIRKLVRHLDVSDGNMEEGSLRCDANISLRPSGTDAYGTRCEVKNLNSIRNLRRAIDFEATRQEEVLRASGKIVQSTLNFDAATGHTSPMRSKEEANDYRYFPDPDLQPVFISDSWLSEIRTAMPLLPAELVKAILSETGASKADAVLVAGDRAVFEYYRSTLPWVKNKKSLINWLTGTVRARLTETERSIDNYPVVPEKLADVINIVDDKKISQQSAVQQLLPAMESDTVRSAEEIAASLNLLISENSDTLTETIDHVLSKFAQQVEAYKKGKKGVLGLFVGEVMKIEKGKADPQKINTIIIEKLK
ncbi:MAG: hypothetical protein EOO00_13290 [Chitinophagaceae bacterium]|nr:MAG: hypothetical protein EOO00_13290 [Chitinophagaceae bacterium]